MRQTPDIFEQILKNLEMVIHGKTQTLKHLLVAFFAGGHILLEDIPGVGKTTLAKALAASISASFRRVQFTPDLLPSDITGTTIYNPQSGEFSFRQGPIFTEILLADEINRTSPRTQSALLEAMSEAQVTVEGKSLKLKKVFTVIATQNPVEFHGTYPLPEAQLDRFLVRLELGSPEREFEEKMLGQQQFYHPLEKLRSTTKVKQVLAACEQVKKINIETKVRSYLLDIVEATRQDPRLRLGVSPRGSLSFYRSAQSLAWSQNRDYVIPDDLKEIAIPVLAHRLLLDTKTRHSGISKQEIIRETLEKVKVPI